MARVWRARKRAMRSARLVAGGGFAEEEEEVVVDEGPAAGASFSSSFVAEGFEESAFAGSSDGFRSATAGSCVDTDASVGSGVSVSEGGGEDAVAVTT